MKHLYLLTPKITPYVKDIGDKRILQYAHHKYEVEYLDGTFNYIAKDNFDSCNGKDLTVLFKIGLSLFLRHINFYFC